MCKKMPAILVDKVVDPNRIIGKKMDGREGGAQGVADPKNYEQKEALSSASAHRCFFGIN
jgi:hypothetical protein